MSMNKEMIQKKGNNTYIKSKYIKVFPCSRRRSTQIDDGQESYHIPFDPEARLSTEFNNRQHLGKNGFTQTFLEQCSTASNISGSSDVNMDGVLNLSIAGYTFKITHNYSSIDALCNVLTGQVETGDDDTIQELFANIRLVNIKLYKDNNSLDYNTYILDSISDSFSSGDVDTVPYNHDNKVLDRPILINTNEETLKSPDNYYFSGLSFSGSPLAEDKGLVYSLQIAKKDAENNWTICEESKLPKIQHGETEDSIVIEDLVIKNDAYLGNTNNKIMGIQIIENETSGKPQLVFSYK